MTEYDPEDGWYIWDDGELGNDFGEYTNGIKTDFNGAAPIIIYIFGQIQNIIQNLHYM